MGGRRAVLSHPLAAPIAIVGTWRGHEGHGYFRSVGFSRSLLTAPQMVISLMGPSEEGQDRSNLFRLYILLQTKRFIYFSYDYRNISLVHLVLDRRVINHDFSSTTMIFNEVENGHAKSLVA